MKNTIALLAALLIGCAVDVSKVPNSLPLGGTNIARAQAQVASADDAVNSAKADAGNSAAPALSLATKFHADAQKSLSAATIDLNQAQSERDNLTKAATDLQAQVTALNNSWGHKLQTWVTKLFWLLVFLTALHLICAGLAIFLPPPYSLIAGRISKIVNPAGWVTWLVSEFEKKTAATVGT